MPAQVNLAEIPVDVRKRLGLKKPPVRSMDMATVRTYAIRVMAVIADLTPAERRRVLRQAGKLNDV